MRTNSFEMVGSARFSTSLHSSCPWDVLIKTLVQMQVLSINAKLCSAINPKGQHVLKEILVLWETHDWDLLAQEASAEICLLRPRERSASGADHVTTASAHDITQRLRQRAPLTCGHFCSD